MINSKDKGKRGERMFRDVLREHGFTGSRRGQQFSGSSESPDVICPELPGIHWEVKYTESLRLYDAIAQAKHDANDKIPIVAHKKNHHDWYATISMKDLLEIIKETELVKS
jgi:Holliday junction resolvase